MASDSTSPRRRWTVRLLTAAFYLLVAGLGYWVFLTITDRYIERRRPVTLVYEPHPLRRVMLAPGQSYRRHDVAFSINHHGLRGRAPGKKEEGELRLFVLGGSSVFDHLLSDRQSWPERLGPYLADRGFSGVKTYNAGVPGYSSREVLALYRDVVRHFRPDVVLIYLGWNDAKYMRRFRTRVDVDRFYRARSADRYRYLTAERPARNWHALVEMVRQAKGGEAPLAEARGAGGGARAKDRRPPPGEPREARTWGESAGMDFWRDNLSTLIRAIADDGALPMLVAQNTLTDTDLVPEARKRISYRFVGLEHDELVELNEAMVAALGELAAENDVPLIDLRHLFNGKLGYFIDHVHMTPLGSQRLAMSVAGCLAPTLEGRGFERSAPAAVRQPPVAHWTFDSPEDGIADSAPYSLDGSADDGVRPVADCKRGGCLFFPGDGGAVRIESRNPLHLSEHFAISLWLRPETGGPAEREGLIVKSGAYHLALRDGRPSFYGYGLDRPGWHVADRALEPGRWHRLTFEHRGDRIRMTVDGDLVYDRAARGELERSSRELVIGGGHGPFAGEIDDVRFELLDLSDALDCGRNAE